MRKCEAFLLDYTDLLWLIRGIRMSRNSMCNSDSYFTTDKLGEVEWRYLELGKKDKKLIQHCLKNDEGSVFEHLVYQWHLEFPRTVLQQLSRHRMGISPTVKSTRYTLEEMMNKFFLNESDYSDFYQGEPDYMLNTILYNICRLLDEGMKVDSAKKYLPESYMSEGIYTMNARAMNHLFRLRNRKKVYPPFVELVQAMYEQIPEDHKFIFEGSFNVEENNDS